MVAAMELSPLYRTFQVYKFGNRKYNFLLNYFVVLNVWHGFVFCKIPISIPLNIETSIPRYFARRYSVRCWYRLPVYSPTYILSMYRIDINWLPMTALFWTLLMWRLLSSNARKGKKLWKSSKPSHVGIHRKALIEHYQLSTNVPGFQSFSQLFCHHFTLTKLATSRIRVK